MLSEEALIVVAAVGACGLLVLGVLELLWPARPRHPVRRPPPPPLGRLHPHRISALTRHTLEPGRSPYRRRTAADAGEAERTEGMTPAEAMAPAERMGPAERTAPAEPMPLAVPEAIPPAAPAVAAGTPLLDSVAAGLDAEVMPPRPRQGAAEAIGPVPAGVPAAEAFFELHRAGRYAEAIETATAALEATTGAAERAALYSVVALGHQAQGDDAEARVALEAAISVSPAAERPAYLRQLAALAERVARERLGDAERRATPDSEERLGALRDAAVWLDCARAATPASAALAELAAGVHALLWPAWERTVMGLVQRQDYRAARRLLREALADPDFPAGRVETFRGLFSGTFSGELGQLTAQAIRSVQDAREADALAALRRAEGLLAALSDEALPPKRRQEVDRRLWWGYRTLGERRLVAGAWEAALEPLFHAFGAPAGAEQREETKALLVRALDGLADARALDIRRLAGAGDHEAAGVRCDQLWALLGRANEMGLSLGDMAGVHGKVQRLLESLAR